MLLLFPPGLDFIAAFFGALYAGAVAVPAYPPRLNRRQDRLAAILADCRPKVALTTEAIAAKVETLTAETPALAGLLWVAADRWGAEEEAAAAAWRRPEVGAESLAFLQYTSGSTAAPKGVAVRHGSLLANEEMIRRAFDQSADSVIVGWLPLHHDMGLIGNVLQPVYVGARCLLMSPMSFLQQPLRWLAAVSRHRATTSGGPNFAYELCVAKIGESERRGLDLSSWDVAFNGAEPVRAATLERFCAAFAPCGFRREAFYPCYGLAEATLFVTGGAPQAAPVVAAVDAAALAEDRVVEVAADAPGVRRLVACGRPWAGTQVVVADPESAAPLPAGRVGEIWVRGEGVAAGYWERPGETAEGFAARLATAGPEAADGPFLRTGDLGFLAGGELYVTGRLKDLIIVRGRNYYPQDVELAAERSHPALHAGGCAAFAVDGAVGERLVVVAEVERGASPDAWEVAAAIRRAVGEELDLQVAEVVLLRAGSLPKTSSGKVRRHACRKGYLAGELPALARQTLERDDGAPEAAGRPREELAGLPEEERASRLAARLAELAAPLLGLPAGRLERRRPLRSQGLDSLAAVELRHRIEADLGRAPALSSLLEEASLDSLAGELAAGPKPEPAAAPAGPGAPEEEQPLSFGQRALWFLERLAPDSSAYHLAGAARLPPALDVAALARAVAGLPARHPALASRFVARGGEPSVRCDPAHCELRVEEEDAGAESDAGLAARLAEEVARRFDLERGPLLRLTLFSRPGGERVLLLVIHHLIADFWSLALLASDLAALYQREAEGAGLPLAAPRSTYADYVRRQREALAGGGGDRLWSFWLRQLAGQLPALELATDRPRPPAQTYAGRARAARLPAGLVGALRGRAEEAGATLFTLLLAGFQSLLGRHSGQTDVIVAVPTAGRDSACWSKVVGYFANPVALRADLAGDPPFRQLLERARQTALAAFDHQDLPFVLLAERLEPQRDLSRTPVFQAMLVFHRAPPGAPAGLAAFALGEPGARLELPGFAVESVALPRRSAQVDLTLEVAEAGDGLLLSLVYNSDLFDSTTAERLLGHLVRLLAGVVADADTRLGELPILSPGERHQLVLGWNDGEEPPPPGPLLSDVVAARAAAGPDAVALRGREGDLSYGELAARSGSLARRLAALGAGPERRVGVLLERSLDLPVALLAVLAAGAAYVPLDPRYPAERLAFMVEDASIAVLVAPEALREVASRLGTAVLWLGGEPGDASDLEAPVALRRASAGDLAYVIYTSGSTGRPKGVAIEHAAATAFVAWALAAFSPAELRRVAAVTSICFDLSVFELFVPLAAGGTVVLAEDALDLARLPAAGGATLVNTVPSAVAELVRRAALPASVETVNLAGEPLPRRLVDELYHLPQVRRVRNLYGPSEDTTYSTSERVERDGTRPPAIGRPIAGTQAFLLDSALRPVPAGAPGELHLGGAGLARGYLGRPRLTAERFVPSPFGPRTGARLYATGDLARHRPDGRLEFLGRADHQVKLRGFRIELGEVEAALGRHPGVADAAVLVRRDAPGDPRLVAYVEAAPGSAGVEEAALRAFLHRTLPDFMLPSAFVLLAALPRTPNGKLDRKALPAAPAASAAPTAEAERVSGPAEELLAGIFAGLLGRAAVGRDEDFFALGGHSLLAARAAARIEAAFGVELPLSLLFRQPTVRSLAEHLAREAAGAVPAPPLAAAPQAIEAQAVEAPAGAAPLSFAQERLWFLHRLDPGECAYNLPALARLDGPLAVAALARTLSELLRRHAVLRARLGDGETGPVQRATPFAGFSLPVVDLSSLGPAAGDEQAGLALAEARRPFPAAEGPWLRAALLRRGAGEHGLILVLHHLAADGWSLGVLAREMAALYGAHRRGAPSPLPEPALQYADFARWQRRVLDEATLAPGLAYWRRRLTGLPPVVDLPTDRPRPAVLGLGGARRALRLPEPLAERLRSLSRRHDVTLFMTLLAAFQALLFRLSGQPDLAVGTPLAGRRRVETESLVGCFVNTLVLRAELAAELPFAELLARTRATTLAAFDHQDVPFERLVEELRPQRARSHAPLFQAALVWQSAPPADLRLEELASDLREIDNRSAKFELTLTLGEAAGGALEGALEHATDLFDPTTARRFARHLATLLAAAVERPATALEDLPLLAEAERAQLVGEWNDTAAPAEEPPAVHELFAARAATAPDAVAVVDGVERLTYGELRRRAARLAARLRLLGVGPEVPVGVCLTRSPTLVGSLLGVLAAGGAYVPLDPTYPAARLAFLMADSLAPVLLTETALRGVCPPAARTILVDAEEAKDGEEAPAEEKPAAGALSPASLAYLIYTSGSTGRPKGVAIGHGSVAAFVAWARATFAPAELAGVLASTSICFDLSVFELFVPLAAGGKVILAPDALALPALPAAAEVTLVNTVPSAMAELVRAGGLPRGVATVNLAGEPLPARLAEAIFGLGVGAVWNLYGPSEDTTYSTAARVERGSASPPIGRPIAGTRAHLVDAAGSPQPIGVSGELYLGGAGLARGYLGRPGLTAERFLPDPFAPLPGARLYRTGDLVRRRADGALDYLGRRDHQVKVRGFRIELGEIETALLEHSAVVECAVLAPETAGEGRALVAYLGTGEGEPPAPAALRSFLRRGLPEHLVPTLYVALPALPRTPNGKLDRATLPAPGGASAARPSGLPPRDAIEAQVAEIWAEVLGRTAVGVEEDFFTLGGHSILAMRVIARLREAFGVELPLAALFDRPTVAALAGRLRQARPADGPGPAPAEAAARGPAPLSFAQERLWFLDRLEPGTGLYNIPTATHLAGALSLPALGWSLSELARRHESLRTRFVEVDGWPVQVVAEAEQIVPPMIDLGGVTAASEGEARRLLRGEALRPFDLSADRMLRTTLVRLGPREHLALLTLHHIAADGWSIGVAVRELSALYSARLAGRPSPLPPLPLQVSDFARWQRQRLRGARLEEPLAYWRRRLAGAPPALELPTDRPRPAFRGPHGASRGFALGGELTLRLGELAREERVTPFMLVLAAFQALLGRWAESDDVCVGVPVAGRGRVETEGLIGLFVNTLVLRCDLGGDPSWRELLRRVRSAVLEAEAHQEVPFERLVEELVVERAPSVSPLFQVLLAFEESPPERLELAGVEATTRAVPAMTAKLDLTLAVRWRPGGASGELEHATDLFDGATAGRMLGQLETLLASLLAAPGRRVRETPLLAGAERHQLLHEWNDTAPPASPPAPALLHRELTRRAEEIPDAVAVVGEAARVSYGELARRVRRLALQLRRLGVGPEVRVAVAMERSPALVTALLAVLEAGGAYVPLDPAYPAERLAFLLADSAAPVLLTEAGLASPPPRGSAMVVLLNEEGGPVEPEPAGGVVAGAEPAAGGLAYLIYTSGSTGRPKGVAISHASACALVAWARSVFRPAELAGVLASTSVCFDLSVFELFVTLAAGGKVILAPHALALPSLPAAGEVTLLNTVPSALAELLEGEGWPVGIATVNLAGEPLPGRLAAQLHARGVSAVWNLYGPSEDTTYSTACRVAAGATSPAIGRPIAGSRAHVLGADLRPQPIGVPGELFLGGEGLARGYLGRPGLTAERFLPDPFADTPGERLYRTGDRARQRPDGSLEFLGRGDQQVKVRGFRIELGEIESALAKHPAVRDCAVLALGEVGRDRHLVAFVAATPAAGGAELAGFLRRTLPEPLIPSAWLSLEALPLTPNGKVDRRALAALRVPRCEAGGEVVAPSTPVEAALVEIWQEVLGETAIGVRQSFFELGGHSLLAARMMSRLRADLGVELPLRELFTHATVEGLAARVEEALVAAADGARLEELLDWLERGETLEPVPRLEGEGHLITEQSGRGNA